MKLMASISTTNLTRKRSSRREIFPRHDIPLVQLWRFASDSVIHERVPVSALQLLFAVLSNGRNAAHATDPCTAGQSPDLAPWSSGTGRNFAIWTLMNPSPLMSF